MKLGAHGPNWRSSGLRAQIMRKSIFSAESHFSWNWVLTAQIGTQAVTELGSWENQFLRPNRNFHVIGCSRPKSAHKRTPSSNHEKINFCGRIAIFMKLRAHGPNQRTSCPKAQIMRKSISTAESQFSWNWALRAQIGARAVRAQIMRKRIFDAESKFSWNWVLTAQISVQAVPELRSWENQFYGWMAIFMKFGPHGPNRRTSGPRAQIMRKSIFTANGNFHEIGCSRPKSGQKPSPSSDHEKINFYGRIAVFMKLGAQGPNRCRSRPRALIIRKSIFTAKS